MLYASHLQELLSFSCFVKGKKYFLKQKDQLLLSSNLLHKQIPIYALYSLLALHWRPNLVINNARTYKAVEDKNVFAYLFT
jgi:hypothetical protein